jgi:hypothetical protein
MEFKIESESEWAAPSQLTLWERIVVGLRNLFRIPTYKPVIHLAGLSRDEKAELVNRLYAQMPEDKKKLATAMISREVKYASSPLEYDENDPILRSVLS